MTESSGTPPCDYFEDGNPIVFPSYCVVADVLGIKKRVQDCTSRSESNRLCQQLAHLFREIAGYLRPDDEWPDSYYQIFSDTVVVGYPLRNRHNRGEGELGRILDAIQFTQLYLADQGFFVRGGLALGELHISSTLCFGKALVEAHELERKSACHNRVTCCPDRPGAEAAAEARPSRGPPRIIVSSEVRSIVDEELTSYSDPSESPHARFGLVYDGRDQQVFVNYLSWTNERLVTDISLLDRHKTAIRAALEAAGDDSIREKFEWAMAYHDFFCSNFIMSDSEFAPSPGMVEKVMFDYRRTSTSFRRIAERQE